MRQSKKKHTRGWGCTAGRCQGPESPAEGRASFQQPFRTSCGASWPISLACWPSWVLPPGHSSTAPPSAQSEDQPLYYSGTQRGFLFVCLNHEREWFKTNSYRFFISMWLKKTIHFREYQNTYIHIYRCLEILNPNKQQKIMLNYRTHLFKNLCNSLNTTTQKTAQAKLAT